jgi:hypothetical protein
MQNMSLGKIGSVISIAAMSIAPNTAAHAAAFADSAHISANGEHSNIDAQKAAAAAQPAESDQSAQKNADADNAQTKAKTAKKTKCVRGRINRVGRPRNGAGPRPQRVWINAGKNCK